MLGLAGVLLAAMASEFNDQVSTIDLPDISGGLALSHDPGTWFASLYSTAQVVGMAHAPWLMLTFTLRQFVLFVLLLNASSSVLIPAAPDEASLYVLRIMQGLSGGLTIPLLMTTALRVLPPPIRLYGLAVYALTATFTPALASSLAAAWGGGSGWPFVFIQAVPLCTAAALLCWHGLPQDPPDYGRFRSFDWRGSLLLLVGLGAFTTMLQQGDRFDWFNSPLISVLALLSAVCIPLLLLNEWFAPVPLIKLQLLGRPNFAYGGVALFTFLLVGQSSSAIPNGVLQQVQGFRPEQFYPLTLAFAAAQLVLLPAVAFLLDFRAVDARVVHFIGLSLVLAACVLSSFVTGDWYPAQFFAAEGMQAVGQAMVVMTLLLMATNTVKGPDEAPFASALVNTPRAIAETVGVWMVQLIQRWRGGLHYNRLADQAGQDRWHVLGAPGSLPDFGQAVEQQARILTISDTFMVLAALVAALMLVQVLLTERTLPPRLQFPAK